jgi:hypothetical protein
MNDITLKEFTTLNTPNVLGSINVAKVFNKHGETKAQKTNSTARPRKFIFKEGKNVSSSSNKSPNSMDVDFGNAKLHASSLGYLLTSIT